MPTLGMISIKSSLSELEKAHQHAELAVASYRSLIGDLAQFTPGLDNETTVLARASLESMAAAVRSAGAVELPNYNVRVRALLQEYGRNVSAYVANLQQERVRTERVLKELAASLSQADDDHDGRIRKTVDTLRSLSKSPDARGLRDMLACAADSIEQSMDKIKREHQYTIAQFHREIRTLQRQLGAPEGEEGLQSALRVFTRAEIQERLADPGAGARIVVIIRARGLRLAAVQYTQDVADQLAAAFLVRMRNVLPPSGAIARWGEEEFLAVMPAASSPTQTVLSRTLIESLPGAYACTDDENKTVRAHIEVTVCAVDAGQPGQISDRIEASLLRI